MDPLLVLSPALLIYLKAHDGRLIAPREMLGESHDIDLIRLCLFDGIPVGLRGRTGRLRTDGGGGHPPEEILLLEILIILHMVVADLQSQRNGLEEGAFFHCIGKIRAAVSDNFVAHNFKYLLTWF